MPFKSRSQARLMYAAAGGYTDKVPKKVAKEYVSASHGEKMSSLPEKVKKSKFHKIKKMLRK